jgi:hypothetical protein
VKTFNQLGFLKRQAFAKRILDKIHPLSGLTPRGRRIMSIGKKLLASGKIK